MAAMGVSVYGILMMMMMIMGAAAQAPAPSVDCTTVVLTLSDCLGYVMGTDKTPPAACCTELSSVVNASPQCLCLLFNTTFTEPLGVNVTIAQQLPSACNVTTPPTSLCASFGVPVPGPVSPGVAPSPATTPASSIAPTPVAPASSPTSPSPSATSPSPTIASSPSPTATTSTGSTGPAGSPETSTTPPNSASAVASRTATVAVPLFLLATIFLS